MPHHPQRDRSGQKYGRWTVLKPSHSHRGYWHWVCKCDCGTERVVSGGLLTRGENGGSTSCGCLRHDSTTIHGMTKTRTFKSWESMLQRCTNPNAPDYHRYGAKGITVCSRWTAFVEFFADMGERPEGKTLDRKDNKKGYFPENCKWSTPSEQQRNKSNSHFLTYEGTTKSLVTWAEEKGIPYDLLLRRFKRNVSIEELFAPSRSKNVSRFDGL
jgi:hypothetical protein